MEINREGQNRILPDRDAFISKEISSITGSFIPAVALVKIILIY